MLILITGDRNWKDAISIRHELCRFDPSVDAIIQGGARGADRIAYNVACTLGWKVGSWPQHTLSPGYVYTVRADWERYGKAAGPIRNKIMLSERPDLVIAFHPDLQKSNGAAHMVQISREAGVPTEVHHV